MRFLLLAVTVLLPLALPAQQSGSPVVRCAALATASLDHASVTSAEMLMAGAAVAVTEIPATVAFCRVKITDTPSGDSNILTEVWLPATGWNGSLHGQGNGGFAGTTAYSLMGAAVAQGYATMGTDTGHVGGTAGFALGHPEKVKDFGWRAIHDMTVEAKQMVAAFYGKPATRAYFTACSDGGREALMEAQRFPADYDGIVAGAPAYHWTALVPSGTADTQALLASPEAYIPAAKIPALAAAVRAQCDKLDGVADGVLNDPRSCHFDPTAIACKEGDADSCLTPPQIASLQTIYAAKRDAQGRQVYPGFLPGAEDGNGGWVPWIVGEKAGASLTAFFGQGYFSNFVYQQPGWSFKDADFAKDLKQAEDKTAAALDATDSNLRPFTERGGKLILYHGWNDPAIPALGTIDYYTAAAKALRGQAAQSLRLYMVPGMQHCGGGPGATEFGQGGDKPRGDAQHDVLTALERWVDHGDAPGILTAKGDRFSRPLCPYPTVARYTSGDVNEAGSFACVAPAR